MLLGTDTPVEYFEVSLKKVDIASRILGKESLSWVRMPDNYSKSKEGEEIMEPIGIALIGLDHWYNGFPMLETIHSSSQVQLRWVIDPDLDKAKFIAEKYGALQFAANYEKALNDPAVQIVTCFCSVDRSAELCIAAAEAGKHIISIKPMAMNWNKQKSGRGGQAFGSEILAVDPPARPFLPVTSSINSGLMKTALARSDMLLVASMRVCRLIGRIAPNPAGLSIRNAYQVAPGSTMLYFISRPLAASCARRSCV